MKRSTLIFTTTALLLVALAAAPAQARWGVGDVNTWVAANGRTAGKYVVGAYPVPTLSVHIADGSSAGVSWVVKNLGGEPSVHSIGFHGCSTGEGFGFRYFAPDGQEVTWKVTHNGYGVADVPRGTRVMLKIVVSAHRSGVSRTCTLKGTGLNGVDYVHLTVAS